MKNVSRGRSDKQEVETGRQNEREVQKSETSIGRKAVREREGACERRVEELL
jgi:hypothetical protein